MDPDESLPGSPGPLMAASPERINQQRESAVFGVSSVGLNASLSSVTDKISQFNSLATQSKHLERKTADAALKRAMLGREEAETEMRRYREETRQMRRQLDESRDRERRVGERLETVMENYGRAKETHAHTQALWEKEIRRARKETFKSQSAIVKLQEELKASRTGAKATEEALEHEKERSRAREQEAFQARYELVGCQEQLEQALEKIKVLEQERDAFKSLANSKDDIARIAAEGLLPLPPPDEEEEEQRGEETQTKKQEDEQQATAQDIEAKNDAPGEREPNSDDLWQSPPKNKRRSSAKARLSSMGLTDIRSSAASEAEIEELTRLWHWEKQRADRASELVDYLEAECRLQACSCMRKRPRESIVQSARKRQALDMRDGGDRMILRKDASTSPVPSPSSKVPVSIAPSPARMVRMNMVADLKTVADTHPKKPRLSNTVFSPEEGIFRTVSQQIAEEMQEAEEATGRLLPAAPIIEGQQVTEAVSQESKIEDVATEEAEGNADETRAETEASYVDAPTHASSASRMSRASRVSDATDKTVEAAESETTRYARTPSVEPPSFALLAQQRTSLLSLLDAPHRQEEEEEDEAAEETPLKFHVPTTPGPERTSVEAHSMPRNMQHELPRMAPASLLVSSFPHPDLDDDADEVMMESMVDMDEASEQQLEEMMRQEDEEAEAEAAKEAAASAAAAAAAAAQAEAEAAAEAKAMAMAEAQARAEAERAEAEAAAVAAAAAAQAEAAARAEARELRQQQNRVSEVTAIFARSGGHRQERDRASPAHQDLLYSGSNGRLGPQQPRPWTAREPVPVAIHEDSMNLENDSSAASAVALNAYGLKTTTTKVPLREETSDPSLAQRILAAQRTPTHRMLPALSDNGNNIGDSSGPSFDVHNPALTPTMSREECLAQIRERRGRARSHTGGVPSGSSSSGSGSSSTSSCKRSGSGGGSRSGRSQSKAPSGGVSSHNRAPSRAGGAIRRPVTPGKDRRDMSAPVARVASSVRRVRP